MAPGQRVRLPRNLTQPQGQRAAAPLGASSSTAPKKNVRGVYKAKALDRLIKKAGHPLSLNISEEKRPVGENNELLSREIGFITRYHAPIRHSGWKSIAEADKVPLYELLKLKFNLDFTDDRVKDCVELLFSSCYKGFHHTCYDHYLLHGGGENAKRNPCKPLVDRSADWIWLCDYFETEEFKKRSSIGKGNRSKLPYVHRKGTKSFVALHHELGCGEVELYKQCYSNQNGWASLEAMENHQQMVAMLEEPVEEGDAPLSEPQICEAVLGKAYGYIRGRGHGPKPNRRGSSNTSNSYQQRLEEELANTKLVVATQQATIDSQQAQINQQDRRIDWLSSVLCKMTGITPTTENFEAMGPSYRDNPSTSSDGQGSLTSDRISRR